MVRRPNLSTRRGTATTETVLVIVPLLMIVGLAPWIAGMFLDVQLARNEAHRDVFDKTATMLLLPDSLMDNHVNNAMGSQFGLLNAASRQHVLAPAPPEIPKSVESIIDSPDGLKIPFTSTLSIDLFPDGFPNSAVEGWEYVRRPGPMQFSDELHFMTYATAIRSPWTRLGWPWVASQDLVFEPHKVQSWQSDQELLDDDMRERLKVAE